MPNLLRSFGSRAGTAGGEGVLASVLDSLSKTIDQRREQDRIEREEKRTVDNEERTIKRDITMAGANAAATMGKFDHDREQEATEKRETQQKQKIARELLRRVGGGDKTAMADALAMGVPAATINAMTPEEAKPVKGTVEDESYARRKGSLRAEQEFNVGAFKPKETGNTKPKGLSASEMRIRAKQALQGHVNDFLEGNPEGNATQLLQSVIQQPELANLSTEGGRPLFDEIRRNVSAELTKARAARSRKGASSMGMGDLVKLANQGKK